MIKLKYVGETSSIMTKDDVYKAKVSTKLMAGGKTSILVEIHHQLIQRVVYYYDSIKELAEDWELA